MSKKLEWMKELKEVKILGKTYKILWNKKDPCTTKRLAIDRESIHKGNKTPEELAREFANEFSPRINFFEQKISLPTRLLANEQLLDSFFHELVHAINRGLGCELNEQNTGRLATGITQIILDNFELRPKRRK